MFTVPETDYTILHGEAEGSGFGTRQSVQFTHPRPPGRPRWALKQYVLTVVTRPIHRWIDPRIERAIPGMKSILFHLNIEYEHSQKTKTTVSPQISCCLLDLSLLPFFADRGAILSVGLVGVRERRRVPDDAGHA